MAERIHNTRSHREFKKYYFYLYNDSKNWNSFADAFKAILNITKKKSIPIVPVVFPLFAYPINRDYPFYGIHKKIEALMQENQVAYLDLLNVFKGMDMSRLIVIPGADLHPNEIAHRIAAESILKYLKKSTLVPSQFFPEKTSRYRVN